MQNPAHDPAALNCTLVSLRVAFEETLKALAEKNGNQPGAWLDEVQELALLRANAHLTDTKEREAVASAISIVEVMFQRLRTGLSGGA
jgi:hypothetical protein